MQQRRPKKSENPPGRAGFRATTETSGRLFAVFSPIIHENAQVFKGVGNE
jgi:hypothetical protein